MALDNQQCYICGKVFLDKVKLGLHLSPCYNEAVTVRKELWHPHPLDLVDEQRYTEYMRGRYKEREREIASAQKKGVSFVSAENFSDIRSALDSNNRNIPISSLGVRSPSRGGLPSVGNRPASGGTPVSFPRMSPDRKDVNSSDHNSILKNQSPTARPVATGVTVLRNELTEELAKIRQLRQTEEQLVEERQRVFEEMCGQIGAIRKPKEDSMRIPPSPSAPLRLMEPVLPRPNSSAQSNTHLLSREADNPRSHMYPLPPTHQTQRSQPSPSVSLSPHRLAPREMPDGRVQCPWCEKLFGKKGYEVHVQRCARGNNDFTWSKDAEHVKYNPEERVKADHDRVSYGRQFEVQLSRPSGMSDEAWTQFMVTYPQPILDDKPPAIGGKNANAMSQAQQNAYNQMVGNELSRVYQGSGSGPEPTMPCGKCGRYFYASRLSKHEDTCLARPRR